VFGGTPNAGMMDEIENPNPDPKTNNWYSRRREIYLLAANARSRRALRSSLVRSTLIGHELNVGSPAKSEKRFKEEGLLRARNSTRYKLWNEVKLDRQLKK